MRAHVSKVTDYRLMLSFEENSEYTNIVTRETFENITIAKNAVYQAFDEVVKASHPEAVYEGIIMVKDLVCAGCGERHNYLKNEDGIKSYAYMDGTFNNGNFKISVISDSAPD